MNETQRRIKAYKAALPGLRERVIAVALLLAMSVAMMTSATFAWITLSRAPEVSGVSTTVAANGNLEIALAQGDGRTSPEESAVGDSAAAENQTITGANITWGNLVNLSDPVYGLNNISLRPALLSEYNLNRYPLYGATYGNDGRVVATTDRYEFASWTKVDQNEFFAAGDKVTHGVRAIASVTYENITGNAVFSELWNRAEASFGSAKTRYINLVTGSTKIKDHTGASSTVTETLGGFLSIYAQDLVNTYINNNPSDSDCSKYIVPIYNMMLEFRNILKDEGEALMELANLQAYLNGSDKTDTFTDVEQFLAGSLPTGVRLVAFSDSDEGLKNDWKVLNDQIAALETLMTNAGFYNENGSYKTSLPAIHWSQFESIMDKIVKISTTEMDGTEIGSVNSSNASGFASSVLGGNPDVLIKDGIIRNLEKRLGTRMADEETMGKKIQVTVKVKVLLTMSPTATVTTDAAPDYYSVVDKMYVEEMNSNVEGGDAVAEDTYGMAIDLWVRTNASNAVLTLEGKTVYREEPAMGTDKYGNATNLYVLLVDGESHDIYKLVEEDVTAWYYANNHEEVDATLMTSFDESRNRKMNKIVDGYQGENRIWENWEEMLAAGLIMEDNTTQGAGSCFVFYGDPSEQSRILDLLNSFTVAFIDVDGNRLGTAMLATDRAYAINGKVTVPLEMVNGTAYVDEEGEERFGIQRLNRNENTRISAIVYLNGMRLENKNVLAEGKIEGNLNLQFGSSVSLTNPDNEKLQTEYRTVTAMANAVTTPAQGSPTASNSASAPILYDYDGTAKQVSVTLTVEGEQPEKISGFFIRTINETQGSRGTSVNFSDNKDGTWTGIFNLTTPGKYVMRSVIVDGAEYVLDNTPAAEISGYTISNVTLDCEPGIHMTADGSFDVEVTAVIDTDPSLMPKQVRAQFRSENGKEFNALMSYVNGRWVGTATINSSGTYTLKYLAIDGEYSDVPEQFQKTLIIKLGMITRIYSNHAESFTYEGEDITIPVQALVWDDSDAQVKGLEGVKLYYHVSGSSLDQNGMQTEMTWNPNTGYYEGNLLLTMPGTYSFDRLQVTTVTGAISPIRNSPLSPTFSAVSLDPPEFYAEVVNAYQLAPKNDAALTVELASAGAAKVWAKVVKSGPIAGTQSTHVVTGTIGEGRSVTENEKTFNVNPFAFTLPAADATGQDGEWVITDLYLQNVYVPNENAAEGEPTGKMYEITVEADATPTLAELADEDKFYHINVANKGGADGIYTYVVSKAHVSVTKDGEFYSGEAFGGTKANPTGTFMQTYDITGVAFTIKDWKGEYIRSTDISAVWSIKYNQATDEAYGGYDGASMAQMDVTLSRVEGISQFTAPKNTLQMAGEYTSTLVVTLGNGTETFEDGMPTYTVASIKPSVTVGTVSPSGSINTTIKWKSGWLGSLSYTLGTKQTNGVNQATNTATAYAQATTKNASTDATFDLPKLTFVVAGVDASSTVKFTIPAGSATAKSFSKVGNGESGAITLGAINPNIYTSKGGLSGTTYAVDGYLGHGDNVKIEKITISRGEREYTVTLDNPIYIKNPSSTPTS